MIHPLTRDGSFRRRERHLHEGVRGLLAAPAAEDEHGVAHHRRRVPVLVLEHFGGHGRLPPGVRLHVKSEHALGARTVVLGLGL